MNTSDRKQTTARLYYKPTGTGGYLNAGDVAGYKFAPEIKYAEWSSAVKGSRRGRCKQPYELHWRWQFNLNEELDQTMKLLRLSSAATVAQAAASGEYFSTTPDVPGPETYYQVGWVWLTGCDYVGDGYPIKGTDWDVNLETGVIATLSDFWEQYNFTGQWIFSAPALLNYTALKSVRATGAFKILEFDQFSEVPRLIHTFDGQAQIIAAPDHDASKPVEYELEVTASGVVTTKKRAG